MKDINNKDPKNLIIQEKDTKMGINKNCFDILHFFVT